MSDLGLVFKIRCCINVNSKRNTDKDFKFITQVHPLRSLKYPHMNDLDLISMVRVFSIAEKQIMSNVCW